MTLVGSATLANKSLGTPPTTKNFYLISNTLRLSFWSGLAFGFATGNVLYTAFPTFLFLGIIVTDNMASRYCYCTLIYYMFTPDCS